MIRTAIEALLRDTPFEIAGSAATGDDALTAIEELRPDVLLLDLQMPDGTGMDVLRAMAGATPAPNRPARRRRSRIAR